MENYQTSQLDAASKILVLLGVPSPHTLQEKVRTIEASKTAVGAGLQGAVLDKKHWIAIKGIAYIIKVERVRQKHRSFKTSPPKICVADWRDDSGRLFWV